MADRDFDRLLARFTAAAESGDGARFAACFTPDAVYHDYIYGPHRGREEIAQMMQGLFHRDAADYRWEMFDGLRQGDLGYAWSLSSFTSTVPEYIGQRVVIDGMSRFVLEGDLVAEYFESVNGGVAMAQLGVEPPRMAGVMRRWAGWLHSRPETQAYLARPAGAHAARKLEGE